MSDWRRKQDWRWSDDQAFMAARMAYEGSSAEMIALKVRKTEWQVRSKLKWHGIPLARPHVVPCMIELPKRLFRAVKETSESHGFTPEAYCAAKIKDLFADSVGI